MKAMEALNNPEFVKSTDERYAEVRAMYEKSLEENYRA